MNREEPVFTSLRSFLSTQFLFSYAQYGGDVFFFLLLFSTFSGGGNTSMTAKRKIKITPPYIMCLQSVL